MKSFLITVLLSQQKSLAMFQDCGTERKRKVRDFFVREMEWEENVAKVCGSCKDPFPNWDKESRSVLQTRDDENFKRFCDHETKTGLQKGLKFAKKFG